MMKMVPNVIQKTIEREVLAKHGVNGLHRRYLPSLKDIQNIVKNIRQNNLIDANDCKAVAKLVESLAGNECCLYYTPQELNNKGEVKKHFALALLPPFGKRMKAFGQDQAFMDAAYGINSYGFAQITVLVQDEFGNGVPCAFLISSSEDAAAIKKILTQIQKVQLLSSSTFSTQHGFLCFV